MFKKILVATDGSRSAANAVHTAAKFAASANAKLNIVHVLLHGAVPKGLMDMARAEHLIESPPTRLSETDNVPANMASVLRADEYEMFKDELNRVVGQKILDSAQAVANGEGVNKVETTLKDGPVTSGILRVAKDCDADLIVVGTRGLGDIKGLLIGSVSHKVSQLSEIPCLIVP